MKIKLFSLLLFTAIILKIQDADAKIRRVGFSGIPLTGTDYTTLQLAHDASAAGDSIYIFPGSWSATMNKRLVIIGYGYSAAALDSGLQHIAGALSISITLNTGSGNSLFQGLDGLTITANASDTVKINRCNISLYFNSSISSANPPFKSWQITQCLINNFGFRQYNNSYIYASLINLLISNCYINTFSFAGTTSASSSGTFSNNIFAGAANFNNSQFTCTNNIFIGTSLVNITGTTFLNNVATTNLIPASNNKINVAPGSIFVGYPTQSTYSNDSRFALLAGSPAKGAGVDKVDCGIFGGSAPYVIGGLPPVPSFYKLTATSNVASSNPYKITFSVKSNK